MAHAHGESGESKHTGRNGPPRRGVRGAVPAVALAIPAIRSRLRLDILPSVCKKSRRPCIVDAIGCQTSFSSSRWMKSTIIGGRRTRGFPWARRAAGFQRPKMTFRQRFLAALLHNELPEQAERLVEEPGTCSLIGKQRRSVVQRQDAARRRHPTPVKTPLPTTPRVKKQNKPVA